MKTLSFIFALLISVLTINSQTLTIGTDYTLTPIIAGTGSITIGTEITTSSTLTKGTYQVNFTKPVDITSLTTNGGFINIYLVNYLSNNTTNVTFTSENLNGASTMNKTGVITAIMLLSNTLTISGSVSTETFTNIQKTVDTTTAHTNGYNVGYSKGVVDGKATCKGTKSEILKDEQISVYPNPVTDNMVSVDVNGTNNQVDLSDETTGFYILNIVDLTGKTVKTVKIVKQ